MAIDMKTVKAITHNNKNLKKIENSNGDIIWGSWDAFPYRRLSYLNFTGDQYIDTLETPQQGYYYLAAEVHNNTPGNGWTCIWGAAHSVSGTFYRVIWQTDSPENNQFISRLKADTTVAVSNVSSYESTPLEFKLRIYYTNGQRFWRAVHDLSGVDLLDTPTDSDGTTLYGATVNNSSYAVNFANFTTSIAIGQYHNNNAWTNASNRLRGKVYRYYVRQTDGSSAFRHLMYPCQRKSDGVCGLYDTVTSTFYPMQGTNITTTACGPVIDEYWDLTA